MLGDLEEEFRQFRVPRTGWARATLWYWLQALTLSRSYHRHRGRRRNDPVDGGTDQPLGKARMTSIIHDTRYAVRTLRRSPGFAAVAIVTLALGIGVNTAIFSVINSVLLRPLPYADPDRLVVVGTEAAEMGDGNLTASSGEFRDFAERATTIDDVAAVWAIDANLTSGIEPERIRAVLTTWNLFTILGVSPMLGRDFTSQDAAGDIGYVAILSFDTWQRLFGGNPDVIGRAIRLDDDPITVIGVMPDGFEHPGESRIERVSAWVPFDLTAGNRFDNRTFRAFTVFGRLRDNATLEASRAEMRTIVDAMVAEHPDVYPPGARRTAGVESLFNRTVGDVRQSLLILFAAVGFVLLAACTNVANLLLIRGQARGRELAIRAALSGGRVRIIRQILTESLILALSGAALGLAIAMFSVQWLSDVAVTVLPRVPGISIDLRVLTFTLAVSAISSVMFGLFPAMQAANANPYDLLHEGRGTSQRRGMLRDALAVAQVAISLVLLVGAGLLAKSFARLVSADPGLVPERVLVLQTWLPIPNDPTNGRFMTIPQRAKFVDRSLEALLEIPAVSQAAMTSLLPFRGIAARGFRIEGGTGPGAVGAKDAEKRALPNAEFRQISPDYFEVLGIPLLAGREFSPEDDANHPLVAVVDQQMAELWFGGKAVGRRFFLGSGTAAWEIVGVVANVRDEALDVANRPHIYVNYRQSVGLNVAFVLKTAGIPETVVPAARSAIERVDRDQPIFAVSSMEDVIAGTVGQERLLMTLIGLFAFLALTLAAIGVYGVVAFTVRLRDREIGIRIALGADRRRVIALVLQGGVKVAAIGLALGLIGAASTSGILRGVLHDVGQLDPLVFVGVATVTGVVVLFASIIPARRAMRVDPINAMRAD